MTETERHQFIRQGGWSIIEELSMCAVWEVKIILLGELYIGRLL